MFFIAFGYGPSELSHINLITCIALKSVYPTWIAESLLFCYLLLYSISCLKGDIQFGLFKKISYASYEWTVICKCYPFLMCFSCFLVLVLLFLFSI